MKLISILEIAALLSTERATVRKKLATLQPAPGPKGAKLYESDKALPLCMGLGDPNAGEFINYAEAQRLLTIKRGEQIDLEMEVTRKQRITLDAIEANNDKVFSNVAGLLKAHNGKTLDDALIHDVFTELRGIGDCLKDGPA